MPLIYLRASALQSLAEIKECLEETRKVISFNVVFNGLGPMIQVPTTVIQWSFHWKFDLCLTASLPHHFKLWKGTESALCYRHSSTQIQNSVVFSV